MRKGRSMNGLSMNGSYRRLARRVLVIRELVGYSRNCQKMFGSSTKKHSRNVRVMENTFEDLSFENWSFEESSFIKMTIRAPKRAQSMA